MKTIKANVSRASLVNLRSSKGEYLRNGQSITKAIIMGGKGCCGGTYVEKAFAS